MWPRATPTPTTEFDRFESAHRQPSVAEVRASNAEKASEIENTEMIETLITSFASYPHSKSYAGRAELREIVSNMKTQNASSAKILEAVKQRRAELHDTSKSSSIR